MGYVLENYKDEIIELRKQGWGALPIAKYLNIPINPIYRLVKEELSHINIKEVY